MKTWLWMSGAAVALVASSPAAAQWTNRYPKVEGYGHHVYLEQEHLPILSSGPTYPAPSPDGRQLAFAHQGWIWLLDLETGVARRLTDGAGVDGRPRWSPDGRHLAFVRDEGSDTAIVVRRLADGSEQRIDTAAIELDPEFTRDGTGLVYTSARDGRAALWRRSIADGRDTKLSEGSRVRRGARALPDGRLLFLAEEGPVRSIRLTDAAGEGEQILFQQGWSAHLDPDLHPSGRSMVLSIADGNRQRLAVMDLEQPEVPRWLTADDGRALHPAFSADGRTIYFVTSDAQQQFTLHRVDAVGGEPSPVMIERWEAGVGQGVVTLSAKDEEGAAIAARLSLQRADGHPVANPAGPTFSDSANGRPYFYVDGRVALTLPAGAYRGTLSQGPFSLPVDIAFEVSRGGSVVREATVRRLWAAEKAGYVSADNHVHLNASGLHDLALTDMLLPMRGEDLDFATPMAWNQHNRFVDAGRVGQRARAADGTTAMLSQEVRSGFHGHVGLIGADRAFHPWFFGPTDPVYVDQDINNGDAIAFAKQDGALPTYVHPVTGASDPFDDLAANPIPYELLVDGVLEDGVGLEIVCQWTSALGTSDVWYRFLNIGRPMPATSGTDMMANFYRTPAVGTARAYVPAVGSKDYDSALGEVRRGAGFVTTGPALLFAVDGSTPGGTVSAGAHRWTIDLASVGAVEKIEIIVNGRVVDTLEGMGGGETRRYAGTVDLPMGGWVAARAVGGSTGVPSMSVFPFAHSSPIWIGEIGSTDPAAARAAATDLLRGLAFSEAKFRQAYAEGIPEGLAARIAEARQRLEAIAR